MNRQVLLLLILLATVEGCSTVAFAQNRSDRTVNQSFDDFRKQLRGEFDSFRSNVLKDYHQFLEGVWQEYDAFAGKKRMDIPKPTLPPIVDGTPLPVPSSVPAIDTVPQKTVKPLLVVPLEPDSKSISFMFYCMEISLPMLNWRECPEGVEAKAFGHRWQWLDRAGVAEILVPAFRQIVQKYGLNEWLAFELIRAYTDVSGKQQSAVARMSVAHYLLLHYGFDVRVGVTEKGEPVLLAAIREMMYERSFSSMSDRRYYLFYDNVSGGQDMSVRFATYPLPEGTDNGKPVSLLFKQSMCLPYVAHTFSCQYGGLELKGELNGNLFPLVWHYPSMELVSYAKSCLDSSVRDKIVSSLKVQLEGKSQLDAVNALLQFVQSAFEYATDDEQHGFEKPYFFEEMLFYPKCDCEDRSLFYSYLLWEVLGIENHVITYPGHACVAVQVDGLTEGSFYEYEGHRYYISDPTYIGAVTGMCMPQYTAQKPEIQFNSSQLFSKGAFRR